MFMRLHSFARPSTFRAHQCVGALNVVNFHSSSNVSKNKEFEEWLVSRGKGHLVEKSYEMFGKKTSDPVAPETPKPILEERPSLFSWKTVTNARDKVKDLMKMYGLVGTITYSAAYLTTFGAIFYGLDSGALSTEPLGFTQADAVAQFSETYAKTVGSIVGSNGLPEYLQQNPRAATAAMAMMATEFTEPLRLAFCFFAVPPIARLVGKAPAK